MKPIDLAVLVSGAGTTLRNLIDLTKVRKLDAQIRLVIGSKSDLPALGRADEAKLAQIVVERQAFSSIAEFSRRIFTLCDDAKVDLVCLAGWLCLLEIPARYTGRVMNVHPAVLPAFGGQGMYGRRVHAAVLNHGCKVSGCTVHFVDESYDTGPIILQRTCPVLDDDTPQSLAARVFELEKMAYPEAIQLFQQGRLRVEGRRVRILPAREPQV